MRSFAILVTPRPLPRPGSRAAGFPPRPAATVSQRDGQHKDADSLRSADRATHLKVVAIALCAAIVVILVALNARMIESDDTARMHGPILKAGKPATYTKSDTPIIH